MHDLSKHMHNSSINVVSTHCSLLFTNISWCRHAWRMLIMDRHFLYSFFLILEFLLWASCPWPNHCCLTQVSHGEQKQKTHSRLSPFSSVASFPWPEWLTSTPAVTLMALAQLSPFLSVSASTLTTVVLYVARNVSTKFRTGREISWT